MDRSWIMRSLREHPRVADGLLAALLTSLSVTVHLVGTGFDEIRDVRDPTWWTVPLVVAASAPVAWRRSAPVTSATVVVVTQCVMELLVVEGTGWLGLIVALYSVGAHARDEHRARAAAVLLAMIAALLASGWVTGEIGVGTVIGTGAVVVAAVLFGDNVRRRRERLDDLAERAERAERERELLARERVRDERSRLARELHDVVAHAVSVMIIQAAAARRSLPGRTDDAVAALHDVEATGRRAMDDLRRVLGVLRTDDGADGVGSLGPQPGIDDLRQLVDDAGGDAGLPVRLTVDPSVRDLPDGVGISVYRLVQEALTNVRRHAGPVERVEVTVRADGDALDLVVADDGRGAASDRQTAPADHVGFGIAGMHERVSALGGEVTAGPRRGGGWVVHARLPVGAGELGSAADRHATARGAR